MNAADLYFVIPTYRLRDVGATVEAYDEHFWRNGHSPKILVFDDSSPVAQEKYYPLLEQTATHNSIYYVGPREKDAFTAHLSQRLRDKRLDGLVKNLFRPSYGGNRNFTLMYTLGGLMVSADDDMRPYALMEPNLVSLDDGEISRGRLHRAGGNGYVRKFFDVIGSFLDVLGKPVSEIPANYETGEVLIDTAMDLETNASQGMSRENSLLIRKGELRPDAFVKMAQTFRSGTNDIDALDFAELFLTNDTQVDPDELNDLYVLANFRPAVTNLNWRMDCGVAGYDNAFGLPPFFPTRLRFEDYVYRLWVRQSGVAAAHVSAAQNHTKSNYMRNPVAAEIFNEEVANLLKRKIKDILDLGEMSDEAAEKKAEEANFARRQLSIADWAAMVKKRSERIKLIVELHRKGLSKRAIAAKVQVDEKTVRKDLQLATADGSAVGPESGKVKGLDGKSRPASRIKKLAKTEREGVAETISVPESEQAVASDVPLSIGRTNPSGNFPDGLDSDDITIICNDPEETFVSEVDPILPYEPPTVIKGYCRSVIYFPAANDGVFCNHQNCPHPKLGRFPETESQSVSKLSANGGHGSKPRPPG